ncbi:MAG: TolC family protein [Terriglobia bacterium]
MIRRYLLLLTNQWGARSLFFFLLLHIGISNSLIAQTYFPMPEWFRENVGRKQTSVQPQAAGELLASLVQDGKLRLTEADAVRLVLQNNLDIVVDMDDPRIAQYAIEKGYGIFDPKLTSFLQMNRTSNPQNNAVTSGRIAYEQLQDQANFGFTQLLPTGTKYEFDYTNFRQSSNSLYDVVLPSLNSGLRALVTQPLLKNFGLLVNKRPVLIARNNKDISDYIFATQLIAVVNQVQRLYWDIVFARDDIQVKQRSLDLATKIHEDNKRQVEIGTLAPIELVKSESEIANRKEELIVAQYTLEQLENTIKKVISAQRDPGQISAKIEPLDKTLSPNDYKDIDVAREVSYAIESRPEIKQYKKDLDNQEINRRYFKNQLLPTVNLNMSYGTNALAGQSRLFLPDGTFVYGPNTGFWDAMNQLFNNRFPTYGASINIEIPIKNRSAQADYAQAQLLKSQSEKRLRALEQQIALEVRNAFTTLEMNRAQIDATRKARELAERNLDAEQKKFQLGTSTIRFVLEEQRNLSIAQTNEVRALTDFTKSKADLDRAVGRTLDIQSIKIEDVLNPSQPNAAKPKTP